MQFPEGLENTPFSITFPLLTSREHLFLTFFYFEKSQKDFSNTLKVLERLGKDL